MRALLTMVRKDLLRKVRAPLGILVLLLFPVIFAVIIAVTFGRGESVPRVQLLVENHDGGFLGNALLSVLDSNEVAEYFDVEIVGEEGCAAFVGATARRCCGFPRVHTRPDRRHASGARARPQPGPGDHARGRRAGCRRPGGGAFGGIARVCGRRWTRSRRSRGPRRPASLTATVASIAVSINRMAQRAERFLDPVVIRLETVDLATGETRSSSAAEPSDESSGRRHRLRRSRSSCSCFPACRSGRCSWSATSRCATS